MVGIFSESKAGLKASTTESGVRGVAGAETEAIFFIKIASSANRRLALFSEKSFSSSFERGGESVLPKNQRDQAV